MRLVDHGVDDFGDGADARFFFGEVERDYAAAAGAGEFACVGDGGHGGG